METVQITKQIFRGVALGKDSNEKEYYIMNGDLFLNESCDIVIKDNAPTLKVLDYEITYLTNKYGDKDGLISTDKLQETKKSKVLDRIFYIDDKWCFPSFPIKKLIEVIIENNLWKETRISISKTRFRVVGRATIFGIDFKKAIFKAIENGVSKTHLYSPKFKDWKHLGVFADFLIKLTFTKEGLIELNSWQAIGEEENLFFVHGIIDKKLNYFTHIDFAYHHTSLNEIQKLLQNGKDKPTLSSKEKILRIDGQINLDIGFDLMKMFYPLDNLVDEYYHCD